MEVGFDYVLDVFWIGGDDVAEDVYVDGSGGRLSEKVSVPVAEIVEAS